MAGKISELPEQTFTSDNIDNCIYIQDANQLEARNIRLQTIFDWIKDKATKNGLTVKIQDERIMFISDMSTDETSNNLSDVEQAKEIFLKLTDEQRMEVLSDYCKFCGDEGPMGCHCMRDE